MSDKPQAELVERQGPLMALEKAACGRPADCRAQVFHLEKDGKMMDLW